MSERELLGVDEQWLVEWTASGMEDLERYLAKHAAFADYLDSHDGDRRRDD